MFIDDKLNRYLKLKEASRKRSRSGLTDFEKTKVNENDVVKNI